MKESLAIQDGFGKLIAIIVAYESFVVPKTLSEIQTLAVKSTIVCL